MEWVPGALVPGMVVWVTMTCVAINCFRSRRLRAIGPTEPAERGNLALFIAGLGLVLLLLGTPFNSAITASVAVGWSGGALVGVAIARVQRVRLERQAARAALELGTVPGPPRAPSLWLTGFAVLFAVAVPIALPAALAASLYTGFYELADTASYTLLAIGYAGVLAALVAAAAVAWRVLSHRSRARAHAALEQGIARRIEDERNDAYRAGFRDGKADAAGYGRGGL
ncbi:MAG: hypothetical protein ABW204_07490 [Microbacteriaceae bacterium]